MLLSSLPFSLISVLAQAVGNWKMRSDSAGLEANGKYGEKTDEIHKET